MSAGVSTYSQSGPLIMLSNVESSLQLLGASTSDGNNGGSVLLSSGSSSAARGGIAFTAVWV